MEKRARKRHSKRRRRSRLYMAVGSVAVAAILAVACYFYLSGRNAPEEASALAPLPTPTATPKLTPEPTPIVPKREVTLYTGRLMLDTKGGKLYGSTVIDYVNPSDQTLYALKLHIYPNAIAPDSTKITALSLNGVRAYYTFDQDKLSVPLAVELMPTESCTLYIEYETTLSKLGYGGSNSGWSLPCAMPVVAAIDDEWLTDAPYGDVTYSAIAEYRVVMEAFEPERRFTVTDCNMSAAQTGTGWLLTADAAAELSVSVK